MTEVSPIPAPIAEKPVPQSATGNKAQPPLKSYASAAAAAKVTPTPAGTESPTAESPVAGTSPVSPVAPVVEPPKSSPEQVVAPTRMVDSVSQAQAQQPVAVQTRESVKSATNKTAEPVVKQSAGKVPSPANQSTSNVSDVKPAQAVATTLPVAPVAASQKTKPDSKVPSPTVSQPAPKQDVAAPTAGGASQKTPEKAASPKQELPLTTGVAGEAKSGAPTVSAVEPTQSNSQQPTPAGKNSQKATPGNVQTAIPISAASPQELKEAVVVPKSAPGPPSTETVQAASKKQAGKKATASEVATPSATATTDNEQKSNKPAAADIPKATTAAVVEADTKEVKDIVAGEGSDTDDADSLHGDHLHHDHDGHDHHGHEHHKHATVRYVQSPLTLGVHFLVAFTLYDITIQHYTKIC